MLVVLFWTRYLIKAKVSTLNTVELRDKILAVPLKLSVCRFTCSVCIDRSQGVCASMTDG